MTTSLRYLTLAAAAIALGAVAGCASKPTSLPQPLPDREQRMDHGYLFYLDGAGGGTAEKNWAGGVRDGMLEAGYPGAGEMVSWETGEGLVADQTASVAYKRDKAKTLTEHIVKYEKTHPDAPVHILGFSAGTAEAIFGIEKLPESIRIDNVVLLGASISQDYDLTEALKRIDGKLYVYTSTHDEMLGVAMKLSGTTDRKHHDPGAGIDGFVLPPDASEETRQLYAAKVVTIRWNKEFEKDGDYGHHFDNVKMPFIRDHVAPLFMGQSVPSLDQG